MIFTTTISVLFGCFMGLTSAMPTTPAVVPNSMQYTLDDGNTNGSLNNPDAATEVYTFKSAYNSEIADTTEEVGTHNHNEVTEVLEKFQRFLDVLHKNDFNLKLELLFGKNQQAIGITLQNTPNTFSGLKLCPEEEEIGQIVNELLPAKLGNNNSTSIDDDDFQMARFVAALKILKQNHVDFKITIYSTRQIRIEFFYAGNDNLIAEEEEEEDFDCVNAISTRDNLQSLYTKLSATISDANQRL